MSVGSIKELLPKWLAGKSYSQIGVLVDENTKQCCLPILDSILSEYELIEIKSGEENKTLSTCDYIWKKLTSCGFDRHALLINLGGGVIGDMGGFCAATYKRGISFINIPTTLLSMVDASVGGKLGIDFGPYKNHIGLFKTPDNVIIDPIFLETLPLNELRSGYAEIIKHALISGHSDWEMLKDKSFPELDWIELIKHSVATKSEIVVSDFKEEGLRKILNFGHTIGHAIESYYLNKGKQKLLHGEAVAIGIICETYLSTKLTGISREEYLEISTYVGGIFNKVDLQLNELEEIAELAKQDKKNAQNNIQAVLLKSIGNPIIDCHISTSEIKSSLVEYMELNI